MKNVITLSAFAGSANGHGGEKRTLQVIDIVKSGVERHQHLHMSTDFDFNRSVSLRNKVVHSFCLPATRAASKTCRESWSLNELLTESHQYYIQAQSLKHQDAVFSEANTIVWENNYPDFFYLPYLIKKQYKKKIVACPQNIEALVPSKGSKGFGKKKMQSLKKELESLQYCDAVFTISEDDQWLLNLLDIPAKFLPFFPTGELLKRTMEARAQRVSQLPSDYFLIVGSVANPPTYIGLEMLMQELEKINQHKKHHFKVAGYGTEIFRERFGSIPGVDILGAIDQSTLDELMANCKAMLINHGYSTGALTKTPEILLSGIPLIINSGAAKSYKRCEGVYLFDSMNEMSDMLDSTLPIPAAPPMPLDKYKQFIEAL